MRGEQNLCLGGGEHGLPCGLIQPRATRPHRHPYGRLSFLLIGSSNQTNQSEASLQFVRPIVLLISFCFRSRAALMDQSDASLHFVRPIVLLIRGCFMSRATNLTNQMQNNIFGGKMSISFI